MQVPRPSARSQFVSTVKPAISPARFVAPRCASLKYAGTVMTARVTAFPNALLSVAFQFTQNQRGDFFGRVLTASGSYSNRCGFLSRDFVISLEINISNLIAAPPDEALD